jgi:hypothetical protein
MIRCRQIETGDLDAVAELLCRGFAGRTRDYWGAGLRRQAERTIPQGLPRFGYLLDYEGRPVGVLLSIYSAQHRDGVASVRCNLSSCYVEPAFRNYAPMLGKMAHREADVVYLNISPASWTLQAIETQGFHRYCGGIFFSLPALSPAEKGMRVEIICSENMPIEGLTDAIAALLSRHAGYGCLSLACRAADGRVFPFVLQPMRIGGLPLPAMQMIYCADVADYPACAGALGRFLLKRGRISIALDANGHLDDLIGFYRAPLGCKYFKGPERPRLADLSDTELVIFGP